MKLNVTTMHNRCLIRPKRGGPRAVTFFILFTFLTGTLLAQTTVNGRVLDEDDFPLPGVTVLQRGGGSGTNGVTTDLDGNFEISVGASDSLVFSYIGYEPQTVPVAGRTTINVTMGESATALDEVVVIGYGTAEQKQITSSVASVDEGSFNQGNVVNPSQLLQGKVAGLSIVRPGGDPNAGFDIRLRGLSTFGANSSPLIIIDGVQGGSLQLVDPNDIESIDVLKDGSAAAIYGTRGSSGVIIVTTKKGKEGQRGLSFDTYLTVEQIAKSVDIATPSEFLQYGGPDLGSETDWVDLVTRDGLSQAYNLALNGGQGQSSYRLSVNYRDVQGVSKKSGFDQFNTRLNLNHSMLDNKLNLAANMTVNLRNASFVPYQVLGFSLISNPTAPVYINNDPEQGYLEPNTTEFHNPVAILNETTLEGKFKTMLGSIRGEYEIVPGLKVSSFYSLQYESNLNSEFFGSRQRFGGNAGLGGRATKNTSDNSTSLFELTGSYNRTVGKSDINLVGGYSYQKFVTESFNAFNTGFITDEIGYNNLGFGLGLNSDNTALRGFESGKGESLLASFFGRVLVDLNDIFFFSAAYRREGSSRFGENNRWGNFYSVSGGVDIATLFDLAAFDRLKFRAGYGVTGNLPSGFYSYISRLNSVGVTTFNDGSSERNIRLFNYVSNANPDLKWEQKGELNLGLDFALLDFRLTGSLDVYSRNSTDILFNQPVSQPPNFYGFTLLNLGELQSRGVELVANYALVNTEEVDYTTGITFSTNRTEIIELNEDSQVFFGGNAGPPGLNGTVVVRAAVGEELGQIQAPIYLGLNADGTPNIQELEDLDGNGSIETFRDWPVVGNALPDFELSWNNSLVVGNFDFSATFRGAFGHSIANIARAYYEVPANANNYNLVVTEYFKPELAGNETWSSYYVEKADYFKLDNASLGYNFVLPNRAMRRLRVYVATQNPFVITNYTGVDPEVRYSTGDPLFPGVEYRNNYFRTRSFTAGVKVEF